MSFQNFNSISSSGKSFTYKSFYCDFHVTSGHIFSSDFLAANSYTSRVSFLGFHKIDSIYLGSKACVDHENKLKKKITKIIL